MITLNNLALLFAPLLLVAIVIFPQTLLYYLILDSWLIFRISDITILTEALTFNRVIVFLGLIVILLRYGKKENFLFPKSVLSKLSLLVIIFSLLCIYSSYAFSKTYNFTILNNLIFYYLVVVFLSSDFKKHFFYICILAAVPIIILSFSSLINSLVHMDIGQRSIGGNRIHTAFHVLLAMPFLFSLKYLLNNKIIKLFINLLLLISGFTILISLGRTVTAIFIMFVFFWLFFRYIKVYFITFIVLCSFIALFFYGYEYIDIYLDKLLRLPKYTTSTITNYDNEDLNALTSGRSSAYKYAWKLFKANFITGIGYGKWSIDYGGGTSLHSVWLQSLVELGIFGFLLYFFMYIISLFYIIKHYNKKLYSIDKNVIGHVLFLCLAAYFLIGITDNQGYADRLFYMFLAIINSYNFTFYNKNKE